MTNTIEFNGEKYYYRENISFTGPKTRHGFRLLAHHNLETKFIAALQGDPAEPSVLMQPIKPSRVSVYNTDILTIYSPSPADYPKFAYKRRALEKWALFFSIHCLIFWFLSLQPPLWIEIMLEIGYLSWVYLALGVFFQMSHKDRLLLLTFIIGLAIVIAFILNIFGENVGINALNPYYLVFLALAWLQPAYQSEYDKWVQFMLLALLEEYIRDQRADLAYWDQNNISPALAWIFEEGIRGEKDAV